MARTKPGVPLSHYIEHHPQVGVLFCCLCGHSTTSTLPAVVQRLKAARVGDERTGIRTLDPRRTVPRSQDRPLVLLRDERLNVARS